jgi:hypothetical protein
MPSKGITTLLMCAIVFLITFPLSMVFMKYYYTIFHSDSAVSYIVSTLILETGQLFPHDFYFSNEIFFLRPQFTIALVRLFGPQGYAAYSQALAIDLSLSACAIAFCASRFDGGRARYGLAAIVLLLPMGPSEYDFVLGQQSHLVTIAITLCILLLTPGAIAARSHRASLAMALPYALLAIDSPSRVALFALCHLLAATVMYGPRLGPAGIAKAFAMPLASICLGTLVHAAIAHTVYIIGVDAYFTLTRWSATLPKMAGLAWSLTDDFFGWRQFDGVATTPAILAATLSRVLLASAFALAALWSIGAALSRIARGRLVGGITVAEKNGDLADIAFLALAGVLLCLGGAIVVVALRFDPVIRHFLAGLVILKFVVVLLALRWGSAPNRWRNGLAAAGLCAFVLACWPIAEWANPTLRSARAAESQRVETLARRTLPALMAGQGTWRLFGSHWNSLKFEVLTGAPLLATSLALNQGQLFSPHWLSRPSQYCDSSPVVYVVNRLTETELAAVLEKRGARPVGIIGELRFLAGPPVWDTDPYCIAH